MIQTKTRIPEIELNFSNECSLACMICSKFHGIGNSKLMQKDVFREVMRQLKTVDFDVIQTSGNGDAFLNPYYFEYLRELRITFPKAEIHFYSSFANLTPRRADFFIEENLINKIFTRLDTLDPNIHQKTTGMSLRITLDNIRYFHEKNMKIQFSIGYSSIKSYYKLCQRILGKKPIQSRFNEEQLSYIKDEFESIQRYFKGFKGGPLTINKINQSLWGERVQAPVNKEAQCPKYQILSKIIWICPNGDISVCGYDDKQCDLISGNIMKENIEGNWNGNKRKDILNSIKNRTYVLYPCNDPNCCRMWQQE